MKRFFSRWKKQSKAKTFELAVWAAEHPVAFASAAGIAGMLLGRGGAVCAAAAAEEIAKTAKILLTSDL